MHAIILAAGRGSRMGARADDRPKGLTPVRGRPLLEWQLGALRAAGVEKTALVTGYRSDALAGYGDVRFHNARWGESNMVVSLCTASAWLSAHECVVSYSDIVYDAACVRALLQGTHGISVTYATGWRELWEARFADPLSDAETFRVNPDGTLAEIGARPTTLDEVQGQYMGLLRFRPDGWAAVEDFLRTLPPATLDRLDMTALLQRLLLRGTVVDAIPTGGFWAEIDSEGDLTVCERLLQARGENGY